MSRSRRTTCACLLLLACIAVPSAADQDYGPQYFEPTEKVVSPHIPWAKPYARGPLKVLFITYRHGMREVVELAERIEMDYDVFAFDGPSIFTDPKPRIYIRGAAAQDAEKRLARKLAKDHDLIVIGNVKWDAMPLASRLEILKKIKAGAGLMGVIRRDEAPYLDKALGEKLALDPTEIVGAFPYENLPAFATHASLEAFLAATLDFHRFGDGRIVLMKGLGRLPKRQTLTPAPQEAPLETRLLDYDYYLSYPIHLMLYAARKAPAVAIRAEGVTLKRGGAAAVTFALSGDVQDRLDVAFIVRDRDNNVMQSEERRITLGGATPVSFALEKLPAGSYFADLRAAKGGRIMNFASVAVNVASDTRIKSIDFAADSFSRTEPVTGTVAIENPGAGQSLRIAQYDNYGRLIRQISVPAGAGAAAFLIPAHDVLSIVQRLAVALVQDGEVVDVMRRRFLINDLYPEDGEIRNIVFEEPLAVHNFLEPLLFDEMARMGFDGSTVAAAADRWAQTFALANFRYVPAVYNYGDPYYVELSHGRQALPGENGPVREWCFSDPDYGRRAKSFYQSEAKRLKRYSTIEFNLGDECQFMREEAEACWSPTCIRHFQEFLTQEYGTLDVLNASYGTDYERWDQIIAPTLEKVKENPALASIWVDHRRNMDSVYASVHADARRWIDEVVPGAKVGYEGSGGRHNSFAAEDFWKLNQAMTLNGPYPNAWFFHFVRDFSPPGSVIGGGIIGSYTDIRRGARNAAFMGYWPWRCLLLGANSFWVYEGAAGRNFAGVYATIAPDFSPYPYFEPHIREVKEIKAGVGRLLTRSQRADDGIAVLYSASSNHVSTLTPGFPSMRTIFQALPGLIEDAGFQFRYVSYQQLADGLLNGGDYRLLILPWCQALSGREIDEIKRFVEAGGTVIADLRPGVTDEHGKPYDTSPLDALFGVRQNTRAPKPVTGRIAINQKVGRFSRRLAAATSDASLAAAAGKAFADNTGAPAVIVNDAGRGRAILLNFSLAGYGAVEGEWTSRLLRVFFTNLLATVSVTPAVTMNPWPLGLKAHRLADGKALYMGLLRDLPAYVSGANLSEIDPEAIPAADPLAVEVELPATAHLYDSRRGEYLGYTNNVTRNVVAGRAQLLALLPYEVTGLALGVPTEIEQGETLTITARIRTAAPAELGRHVLRLSLVDPDGNAAPWLARNVETHGGTCTVTLEIALNERPGKWTINGRDAATGLADSASFTVVGERVPAGGGGPRAAAAGASTPEVAAAPPTRVAVTSERVRYQVYHLGDPVSLDGRIDIDPAWNNIPWAAGFRRLGSLEFKTPKQTLFKMAHDGKNFYLAVRCDEPDMAQVKGSAADNANLWQEDSVELFLFPQGQDVFFQYVANADGARWSFAIDTAAGSILAGTSLDAWRAAAHKGEDFWSVEIAVPFDALGTTATPGAAWTGNVCRNVTVFESGGDQHTSWAPMKERFREQKDFGELRFEKGVISRDQARRIEQTGNASYRSYLRTWLADLAARAPALRTRLDEAARLPDSREEILRLQKQLADIEQLAASVAPDLERLVSIYRTSCRLENQVKRLAAASALDELFD